MTDTRQQAETRGFLEWLVSLDSDDAMSQGRQDRRTVTLQRITDRAAAVLVSSSPALPEPPAPEPGRWWRVLSVDGDLWCETSDEAEAREALAQLEGPGSLWRLYVTRSEEWREVAAADVAEEGTR